MAGELKYSYATGNIAGSGNSNGTGYIRLGGLTGTSVNTNIEYSYATGNVSGTGVVNCRVGGLAGVASVDVCDCSVSPSNSLVSNCFSTGNVEGSGNNEDSAAGGLIGFGGDRMVNSYTTGNVSITGGESKNIGRLSGKNVYVRENTFYNSEATITKNGQAITPSDSKNKKIFPKPKVEMQSDTFTGLLNVNGTSSVWGRDDTKNDKLPYIKGVGVGK